MIPSAGAVALLLFLIIAAAVSGNRTLMLGFFVPLARFCWSVEHDRAFAYNLEVCRLGGLVVQYMFNVVLDMLGGDRRCNHHGVREVVRPRRINFVL